MNIRKVFCAIGLHKKNKDHEGCYGLELMPVELYECPYCSKQWIRFIFSTDILPVKPGMRITSGQVF